MTGRNKHYSDEFKAEAVRFSYESGLSLTQACKDLGIGKSTLHSWRQTLKDQIDLPSKGSLDDAKELSRLRKENQILKIERDLLKKATVFFAKEVKQ